MKKCGIITYHFANNYGAVLQCFALRKAINSIGYDCNVLNFISEKQLDNNSLYRKKQGIFGVTKNVLLLPFSAGRKKRAASFCNFRNTFLNCTERIDSIALLKSFVMEQNYDILISGSDQVWNPNVYDFNEAFFLPFSSSAKKVGYAVSLGNAEEEQLAKYKKWISDFDAITVREQSGIQKINNLCNMDVTEVLDPVFLINTDVWEKMTKQVDSNPYLLCYFVREEDLGEKIRRARKIAKEKKLELKIVNLRITKYNFTNNIIYSAGPEEFLNLFRNAEYVYTDSFHGTAFSIIYKKNFTTVESTTENAENRKRNLLSKLGLESRILAVKNSQRILPQIDYHSVDELMSEEQQLSMCKLEELLTM